MRFLPISKIVVHHSCGGSWESIKEYHKGKGWGNESAYHAFLPPNGIPQEGRSETDYSPATQSWVANHSGLHICLDGNFEQSEPTKEQLNTLKRMIQHKMKIYKIKPENVVGHCDINPTKCPGKKLINKLEEMRHVIPSWAIRDGILEDMKASEIQNPPTRKVGEMPLYEFLMIVKKLVKYLIKK